MHDERLYDEKELEKSWLISYSDLFTLLFVIIVIIAASHSSQIQIKLDEVQKAEAKQQAELKEAIESVDILELKKLTLQQEIAMLQTRRDGLTQDIIGQNTKQSAGLRDMETVKTQLSSALQEQNIDYIETDEGLVIRLPEKILFHSGEADLDDKGKQTVATIARVLKRFPQRLRVEGYTDNRPITSDKYPSNWELSYARAISVMREMMKSGELPVSRFTVAGLGEYKPLVDNSSEENRAHNRRVEVVILAEQE